jgi:fructose transport system permease protein
MATCGFFATQSDRFLTGENLSLVLQQVMVVGVLAIGQTLIILTAGIDLSCGMVMALGGIVMTKFAVDYGMHPVLAAMCGVGVTCLFGLINGLLVTRIKLPSFIVTLGTMNISLGTVAMVGMYVLAWHLLRDTASGRHVYAVGNNPEAARLTGIPVERVLLSVYVLAGFLYGIAALLLVARTEVGDPQAGQTENLDAITAVVLGGTSLFGGRGVILGSLVGAVIVGVFRNGLTLMGVASVYQTLITGILVILAVAADQLSRKGAR